MSPIRRSLTTAGLGIGVLMMGAGVVLLITPRPELTHRPLWGTLFTQGVWILMALCGALFSTSRSLGDRLGLHRGKLPLSTSLILLVGFVALSNGLHQGLVSFELRETGALAEIDGVVRRARGHRPSFLLALLAMGIAPGFGEEMLFRGFLQRGLAARLGPRWGVLLAAAVFALAHYDLIHSSTAFLMGAYLGVVTQLAGSIRTPILCHVLNNTLGLLSPALGPRFVQPGADWMILPLLATAAAALLYAAWRGSATAPESRDPSRR